MTDAVGSGIPEDFARVLPLVAALVPDPCGTILVRGERAVETGLLLKRRVPSRVIIIQTADPSRWEGADSLVDHLISKDETVLPARPDALVFAGNSASFQQQTTSADGVIPDSCWAVLAAVTPDPANLSGPWIPARAESRETWHLGLWYALDPLPESRAMDLLKQQRFGEALQMLRLITIPADRATQILRERLIITCIHELACRGVFSLSFALSLAQRHWFSLLALNGETEQEFHIMADLWVRCGDGESAAKLLALASEKNAPCPPLAARTSAIRAHPDAPPPWPKKVLFILPRRAHYGLDVLYEGLCDVLGDRNVVDFPWKPTLHGQIDPALANYPCQINRGADAIPFTDLLEQTRTGRFDLLLLGVLESDEWEPEMAELVKAADERTPIVLADALDEMDNFREAAGILAGTRNFMAYLKRERIRTFDYGPDAIPFPFAYPDRLVPDEKTVLRSERDIPLFWAGKPHGTRRHWLERARQITGLSLNETYPPDQYKNALLRARTGLNLAGGGFDTVRYWEIPAHGALLLSESLPIEIPHDFRHGVNALFFRTPGELADALEWCSHHPEDARDMALSGYRHFKSFHTATARARQILWALYETARCKGAVGLE